MSALHPHYGDAPPLLASDLSAALEGPAAVETARPAWLSQANAYLTLTKPRISLLVLVVVAVSGWVARWGSPDVGILLHALLGTALVAASSSAVNQWIERERDARMARTRGRPLPAGLLSASEVLGFAALTLAVGFTYLAAVVNWTTALLGLATWLLYVVAYTPLKVRTPLNTHLGAVAGALPVWIGWSAVGAPWDVRAAALFSILFLWQFPHFMAIAWLYREDYARAGMKMLTVVDPTGRRAGVLAVITALVLTPVSLVPAFYSPGASLYAFGAVVLGVLQLAAAVSFFASRDELSARRLLQASLIYLPALLVLLLLTPSI